MHILSRTWRRAFSKPNSRGKGWGLANILQSSSHVRSLFWRIWSLMWHLAIAFIICTASSLYRNHHRTSSASLGYRTRGRGPYYSLMTPIGWEGVSALLFNRHLFSVWSKRENSTQGPAPVLSQSRRLSETRSLPGHSSFNFLLRAEGLKTNYFVLLEPESSVNQVKKCRRPPDRAFKLPVFTFLAPATRESNGPITGVHRYQAPLSGTCFITNKR